MPDILEQLRKTRENDTREAKAEYVEILRRAVKYASPPEDAGRLSELLKALGRTEADFAKDERALRDFFQAETNLASLLTDDEIRTVVTTAVERRNAAAIEFQAAQQKLAAAWGDYNGACGLQTQKLNVGATLRDARAAVAHLLD
jgi:Holliday junction resolvasome RuvABC endonuclease subunit